MSHKKRLVTDEVEADLPITPMLDMSFQLLAFFVMTFHPAPTEAQIALALPQLDAGPGSAIPDISSDKPAKYIVHAESNETGQIRKITLREDGAATDSKDLGSEVSQTYFSELKTVIAQLKGKPAKLTIEIDDKLLEAYVVGLIDHAIRAGFTDISPVPTDGKKR